MTSISPDILILGAGVTGRSLLRYAHREGKRVAIWDDNPKALQRTLDDVEPSVVEFRRPKPAKLRYPIMHSSSESLPSSFISPSTLVIPSPGIRKDHPVFQQAISEGGKLCSEFDYFLSANKTPIIGITGTNGKSTVTSALGYIAKAAGLCAVAGGNLGQPVCDYLQAEIDLIIIECSSFQLELTKKWRSRCSVILNLSPDHYDRHNTESDYLLAKQRIYENCEYPVLNADQPLHPTVSVNDAWSFSAFAPTQERMCGWRGEGNMRELCLGDQKIMTWDESPVWVQCAPQNASATAAIALACGFSISAIREGMQDFSGLPHRMQLVPTLDQRLWYNDSKATNLGAVIHSLSVLWQRHARPIWLICGGMGKGVDFTPLRAHLENVKGMFCFGEDGERIASTCSSDVDTCKVVMDLASAVTMVKRHAQPGEIICLAPACSSLDQFSHYAARGDAFMQLLES